MDGIAFGNESSRLTLLWARIFTTSANLVPSVLVKEQSSQDGMSERSIWKAFISARDMAVFELQPLHVAPNGLIGLEEEIGGFAELTQTSNRKSKE
jgi:hypothetical protein